MKNSWRHPQHWLSHGKDLPLTAFMLPQAFLFPKSVPQSEWVPFQLYFQGFLNPKPDLLSALGSNSPELFGFCSQSHQCLCRERTGVKLERILPKVECQNIFYKNIAQNFFKKIGVLRFEPGVNPSSALHSTFTSPGLMYIPKDHLSWEGTGSAVL